MNTVEKAAALQNVLREQVPLIHQITNYVTVNDVANAVLAIGASPIMADDMGEAADIAGISAALVINIGTLNERTIQSMLAAGKRANEKGIPVIFDPVGAGASALRNETTRSILEEVRIAVLRGNLSEVSYIAGLSVSTKGVDSSIEDERYDSVSVAKAVAEKFGCVTAVTGAVDVISDGKRIVKISNGHRMLSKVTGTGCMTSALVGAYAGAVRASCDLGIDEAVDVQGETGAGLDLFTAAVGGVLSMGIAGEIAYEAAGSEGTGSFHIAIIDALSKLDGKTIAERARIQVEE